MTTTTAPAVAPLDAQAAYETVHNNLYAPVFFNKLAAYGITPQTPEEAQEMLKLAAGLRETYAHAQQAEPVRPLLKTAMQHLDNQRQRMGMAPAAAADAVKQAAAVAAADPAIAHALLSLSLAGAKKAGE